MTNRAAFSRNIFLYDRVADQSVLVSHIPTDPLVSGDRFSSQPHLSDDGRYLVYQSQAGDLIVGQQEARIESNDVFVYDRVADENALVTHAADSPTTAVGAYATKPLISADGSVVVYDSSSKDLVTGQIDSTFPGLTDVFAYLRSSGENILVSHRADDESRAVDRYSVLPVVSGDGRFIAYFSRSPRIISGQIESFADSIDLFLFDRTTQATSLVSHSAGAPLAEGDGHGLTGLSSDDKSTPNERRRAVMSQDGAVLAYTSFATDLLANSADRNVESDVFLYDRATGENSAVSTVASETASLTANKFWSYFYNLTGDDLDEVSASADGRFVAFVSSSPNLVAGQQGRNGVFLYDRLTQEMRLVSHAFDSPVRVVDGASPSVSADGNYIAYESNAKNLVEGQVGSKPDGSAGIVLYDRQTGVNRIVSHEFGSPTNAAQGSNPTISDDGRYIVYEGGGLVVVEGQTEGAGVVLYDRVTDTSVLVDHKPNSPLAGSGYGGNPSLSADGRFVAYESWVHEIVEGVVGQNFPGIYLYDRLSGVNTFVSHVAGEPLVVPAASSERPLISATGDSIVYRSSADNLVAGQDNSDSNENLFYYNRLTGETTLITHLHDSPNTAAPLARGLFGIVSDNPVFQRPSRDDRYVVYKSLRKAASDLAAGVLQSPTQQQNIFRYDATTNSSRLISYVWLPDVSPLPIASGGNWSSSSDDARYIAYTAPYFEERDYHTLGSYSNVHLYDAVTGETRLVSGLNASTAADRGYGDEVRAIVSADGSTVIFLSNATLLVPQDHNREQDLLAANVAAPEAVIDDVAPSPRNTPVLEATLAFINRLADGSSLFTPIDGFDLSDLSLTRDGGPNLLTAAQTLTLGTDGHTWTLGNLGDLTGEPGEYVLTVLAADSGIQNVFSGRPVAADAVETWTFSENIIPPVLGPIGNRFGNDLELLSFQISATDEDSDALTYQADPLPMGAEFDGATRTFKWTPLSGSRGTYTVRFQVSDGGEMDSEEIVISIGSPWHNTRIERDVNRDGTVTPIDALVVINELNEKRIIDPITGRLPDPPPAGYVVEYRYDVNNDGLLVPIDVLLIINYLNRVSDGEGESEGPAETVKSQWGAWQLRESTGRDTDTVLPMQAPNEQNDDLNVDSMPDWESTIDLVARARMAALPGNGTLIARGFGRFDARTMELPFNERGASPRSAQVLTETAEPVAFGDVVRRGLGRRKK